MLNRLYSAKDTKNQKINILSEMIWKTVQDRYERVKDALDKPDIHDEMNSGVDHEV